MRFGRRCRFSLDARNQAMPKVEIARSVAHALYSRLALGICHRAAVASLDIERSVPVCF